MVYLVFSRVGLLLLVVYRIGSATARLKNIRQGNGLLRKYVYRYTCLHVHGGV